MLYPDVAFTIRRHGGELHGHTNGWTWEWAADAPSQAASVATYGARPGGRKWATLQAMKRGAQSALKRAGQECYF